MGKPIPSLLMLLLSRGRIPLDCPTQWQDGRPSHSSNHVLHGTCKIMPQARLSILILNRLTRCEESTPLPLDMQLFGCGVWLPKALAESKNQVLAFSSFSVTLLRLNVYLSNHTWYQTFSNQHFCQFIIFPLVTQCSSMNQAVSLAARSRRFESSF